MLVLMGTGSGKFLCILLPAFIEGDGHCTIVFTPLAALVVEWKEKCNALGLKVASWEDKHVSPVQVYIFAAEHVDTSEYRTFVRDLSSRGSLKRIVFDEAHEPITWDDFRPSMFKARFILGCSTVPVQRVLLSATVPPFERESLLVSYGMREAYLFAAATVRKILGFQVLKVGGSAVGDGSIALLKELSRSIRAEISTLSALAGTNRIMVFVMRVKDTEVVRKKIAGYVRQEHAGMTLVYHGKLSESERQQVQKDWNMNEGKVIKVMICTSAIGAGTDSSNIRVVYHLGGCSSLVQFAQECGRAGRSNEHAKCILLWSDIFASKQEKLRAKSVSTGNLLWEKEYEERKYLWWDEMVRWAQDKSRCRRSALFRYLDGTDVPPCIYDKGVPCDICLRIHEGTTTAPERRLDNMEMNATRPMKDKNPNSVKQKPDQSKTNGEETETLNDLSHVIPPREPGETMVANHNKDKMTRRETLDMLSSFETVCRRLDGLCIICVVLRREERIAVDGDRCEACSRDKNRCYRCLATDHRFGDCHLPRFVKNHCNRCGLNKLDGKSAHQGIGFAQECPRPHLNNIFWLLWSEEETRQQMLCEACTTSQRSIIRDLVRSEGPYAKKTVETVLSWLHNKSGMPTHVRILCCWGATVNE